MYSYMKCIVLLFIENVWKTKLNTLVICTVGVSLLGQPTSSFYPEGCPGETKCKLKQNSIENDAWRFSKD